MIVIAGRYDLIRGGYQSEQLQLTPDGNVATSDEVLPREKTRARIKLAVDSVEIFKGLYEKYNGQKLPVSALLEDASGELGVPGQFRKECIEVFIVNLHFAGLLQTLSGAERILTLDHALDQVPGNGASPQSLQGFRPEQPVVIHSDAQFERMCSLSGLSAKLEASFGNIPTWFSSR